MKEQKKNPEFAVADRAAVREIVLAFENTAWCIHHVFGTGVVAPEFRDRLAQLAEIGRLTAQVADRLLVERFGRSQTERVAS